ncbi:MAG: hypothetical protein GY842_22550, partial [bacterium]|nr:hypothetical protein [bacterium]
PGGIATSLLEAAGSGAVAGPLEHRPGNYGYRYDSSMPYDYNAPMELVDNGNGITDGCALPVGFTPGNIALIDRGGCEFGAKTLNAELAGAIAVIILNNDPNQDLYGDGGIWMGGGDFGGSVTIGATIVHYNTGELLKANLGGLNGRLWGEFPADRGEDCWTLGFFNSTYQTCVGFVSPNDPNPDNDTLTLEIPVCEGSTEPQAPVASFTFAPAAPGE